MLDLESQGPGSIPTGGNYHFLFYNLNLHNIARSGRIRFKMKNPTELTDPVQKGQCSNIRLPKVNTHNLVPECKTKRVPTIQE